MFFIYNNYKKLIISIVSFAASWAHCTSPKQVSSENSVACNWYEYFNIRIDYIVEY